MSAPRRTAHLAASALALLAATSLGACSAARRAAEEDPMRCERDPRCEKKRGRTADCSTQCADDPACVQRCTEVQQPNGPLGH